MSTANPHQPQSPTIRVLVVDDHPLYREAVTAILSMHGLEVVARAADGAEAVRLARALRPDVVLMDINMPRMDGVEATRRIRAELGTAVVVVSSSTAPEDVTAAHAAGAAAYLVKHAPPAEVVDAVVAAAVPPIPNRAPAADLRSDGGGALCASAAA